MRRAAPDAAGAAARAVAGRVRGGEDGGRAGEGGAHHQLRGAARQGHRADAPARGDPAGPQQARPRQDHRPRHQHRTLVSAVPAAPLACCPAPPSAGC